MTCALITGGRDFADYAWGYDCLDAIHTEHRLRLLVIGLDPKKRKGVDWMGYEWAESRGVDTALFPPNWTGRGRPGGPYRNSLMVRFLVRIDGPKIAIVLPGQSGTANCAEQAHKAGIQLIRRSPPASGIAARSDTTQSGVAVRQEPDPKGTP